MTKLYDWEKFFYGTTVVDPVLRAEQFPPGSKSICRGRRLYRVDMTKVSPLYFSSISE
jgi:hypothetical protein